MGFFGGVNKLPPVKESCFFSGSGGGGWKVKMSVSWKQVKTI